MSIVQTWVEAWTTSVAPSGSSLDEVRSRPRSLSVILIGLLVGLGLGIALRGWMRLVSTRPEFTWEGTSAIVGAFAVLGLAAAVCALVRAKNRPWVGVAVRGVAVLLSLACFTGQGLVTAPTVVTAGLALAHPCWPRVLRRGLLAVALAGALVVPLLLEDVSWGLRLLALLIYLPLMAVESTLLSHVYAPTLPPGSLPMWARVGLALLALTGLGWVVVAVTGLGVS